MKLLRKTKLILSSLLLYSATAITSAVDLPTMTGDIQQEITSSSILSRLKPYPPYIGAGIAITGISAAAAYGLAHHVTRQDNGDKVASFIRIASGDQFYFFKQTRLSRLWNSMSEQEKKDLVVSTTTYSDNIRDNIIQMLQQNNLPDLINTNLQPSEREAILAQPTTNDISFDSFAQFHFAINGEYFPMLSGSHHAPSIRVKTIKMCIFKGITARESRAFLTGSGFRFALSSPDISAHEIRAFLPENSSLAQDHIHQLFNSETTHYLKATGLCKLRQLCTLLNVQPQSESTLPTTSSSSSFSGEWPYVILLDSAYYADNLWTEAIKLCPFKGVTPTIREAFFTGKHRRSTFAHALRSNNVSAEDIARFFPKDKAQKEAYFSSMLNQLASESSNHADPATLTYPTACHKLLAVAGILDINIWQAPPHMCGLALYDVLVEDFIQNCAQLEDKSMLIDLAHYFCAQNNIHVGSQKALQSLEKCLDHLSKADCTIILLTRAENGESNFYNYILSKLNELNLSNRSSDASTLDSVCNKISDEQFTTFLSHINNDQLFINSTWWAVETLCKDNIQITGTRLEKILAICDEKKKELLNLCEQAKLVFPITLYHSLVGDLAETYHCATDILERGYRSAPCILLSAVLPGCNDRTLPEKRDLLLHIMRYIGFPRAYYWETVVKAFNKLNTINIKPNTRLYPDSDDKRTFFHNYVMATDSESMFNSLLLPLCSLLTDVELNDEIVDLQATPYFKEWYKRNKGWLQKNQKTCIVTDKFIAAGERSSTLHQSAVSMLLQELERPLITPQASTSSS